jgi:hypothetical protein
MVAVRRRRVRSDLSVGAALAVVLSATIVLVTATTPAKLGYDVQKGLLWTSPAGMFAWLILAWSVATMVRTHLAPRTLGRGSLATPALVAGLALVTLIAGATAAKLHGGDSNVRWYQPVRTIISRAVALLPHDGVILVDARGDTNTFAVETALIYQLRKRGYRVSTLNGYLDLVRKLGAPYDACRSLPERTLLVTDDGSSLAPSSRLIASVAMPPNPIPGGFQEPGPMRVSVVGGTAARLLVNCAQSPHPL